MVFNFADTNKDDKVSFDEARVMQQRMGANPSDAELKEFMSKQDTNRDGFIER